VSSNAASLPASAQEAVVVAADLIHDDYAYSSTLLGSLDPDENGREWS